MKALAYLLLTQLKNRILYLKRKPAMLILYCVVAVMIIFSVVMLTLKGNNLPTKKFADERILFTIIAGLGLFFLYAFINSGLSTGSSLFTMPDIGLLFVSPISSKKILMYGLLSTMGKALLGSVFIFYQMGTLKSSFGYGFLEIFSLFAIFAIMILFCQLMSIGIYIFTNGKQFRKSQIKATLYCIIVFLLLVVVFLQKQEQINIWEAIFRVVSSKLFGYLPVAGWSTMFFIGIVNQSLQTVIIPLLCYLVVGIVIVILLTVGKADYYEDVLLSTETTYNIRLAAKEGRNIPRVNNKNIKVRNDEPGIHKGKGAITFLYKHILEMKRSSRLIFLDKFSYFMIILLGISGYYLRTKAAPQNAYYIILGVSIYFQFFTTVMGKLKVELLKPYIYLIPEKSIVKVIAASLSSFLKPCIDGVAMFAVFTITSEINPVRGLFFALAYIASGAVFVGMTILYQRFLGGQPSKIIQMLLGAGLLLVVMAPSIGVSVAAAILLPASLEFLCTLPYTIFCLLFTVLIVVLCGNLIDKTEYTGKS